MKAHCVVGVGLLLVLIVNGITVSMVIGEVLLKLT